MLHGMPMIAFVKDNFLFFIKKMSGTPIEDNCTTLITCPSGFVYRNPLPIFSFSIESCCVAVSEDKFPWVWILVGVPIVVVSAYFFYKYLNRGKL